MSDYDSIAGLQEQGLVDSQRVATIKIFLVSLCHGAMFVMIGPQIFSIWLDKQVHLDSLQIGELLGMKGIVAVFYKPLFGWLLDKTQLRIRFVITLGIGGLAAGPFFQFIYKPLLMTHNPTLFYVAGLLGGIYFGYVVIAGGPAVWSYCGRYIQAHGGTVDKLGLAHRAGSLFMGFALVMVYTINPILGFYLASIMAFIMIVVLLTLKVKPFDTLNTRATSKQKIQFIDLKKLIFNPRFYVLAFFALSIMVVVYAQFGQVGRYTLSFWPKDHQMFGLKINTYVTTVVGFIQMFLLFHASKLIKKISPSKSVILIGVSYAVAMLVLGIASIVKDHSMAGNYMPSLIVAMVARQLLGLVNPFTLVVVLSYVTTSFNKKIVGIAFLSYHFLTTIGGSVGAGIVGGMFKIQGWGTTYCELSAFVFICAIVLSVLMVYSNKYDRTRVMEHLENKKEV